MTEVNYFNFNFNNKEYEDALVDLDNILNIIDSQIVISDKNGYILRSSNSIEESFGMKKEEIIGVNIWELEKKQIISETVAGIAIKTRKKVTRVQNTRAGKRLIVTSTPIFNENNELLKIISISKDITEIAKLKEELYETIERLNWFKKEIINERAIKKGKIIGNSVSMKKVVQLMSQISNIDVTVLITGETGVGKNLVAKTIHNMSNRKDNPFVEVNCGALSEHLLESELFGYEKGAFTGANDKGKKGIFETAYKGTIFLDEIGEIPLHLQVKLLQALENKTFYKLGNSKPIIFDARIIVATNKDLNKMVKEGKFREDLFYRLNIIPILLPPLRDRKDEIVMLTYNFMEEFNEKYNFNKKISPSAYNTLIEYNWPGNVRELKNVVERLIITSQNNLIEKYEIINIIKKPEEKTEIIDDIMPLKTAREIIEKQIIINALKKYKTTRKVGEILEVDQSTIVKKIKKYEIEVR